MAENTIESKSGGALLVDLAVTLTGMNVAVGNGTVRFNGANRAFDGDDVDLPVEGSARVVDGYIVRVVADDSIELFVDDGDGYTFARSGPYECIAQVFSIKVPASATTLEGLDFNRYKIASE